MEEQRQSAATREIPELMQEPELCALLQISPTTAWRLRANKKLGYCREAGKVWYLRRHVIEFLNACEVPREGAEERPRLQAVS
jgi:hypothetical protein